MRRWARVNRKKLQRDILGELGDDVVERGSGVGSSSNNHRNAVREGREEGVKGGAASVSGGEGDVRYRVATIKRPLLAPGRCLLEHHNLSYMLCI